MTSPVRGASTRTVRTPWGLRAKKRSTVSVFLQGAWAVLVVCTEVVDRTGARRQAVQDALQWTAPTDQWITSLIARASRPRDSLDCRGSLFARVVEKKQATRPTPSSPEVGNHSGWQRAQGGVRKALSTPSNALSALQLTGRARPWMGQAELRRMVHIRRACLSMQQAVFCWGVLALIGKTCRLSMVLVDWGRRSLGRGSEARRSSVLILTLRGWGSGVVLKHLLVSGTCWGRCQSRGEQSRQIARVFV
mmetsp:Transcript_2459/g.7220  ORF Transcript_2459/g.7220 Transcript_2459/m.7220 type:complete len:249 (-) Transcript_2459:331-1077(-)